MDGFGISIEGLGRPDDVASNSAGTIWAYDDQAPTNASPDGTHEYKWTWGLAGFVTPSGYSSVPETGEVTVGAFSAEMHASVNQVTRVLLARQDEPTTQTENDLDIGDGIMDLPSAGLYSANDVIYIGAETIRIISDDGAGSYTVERGFFDSTEVRHPIGSGVYDRPPFYRNRSVTLWTHDGSTMTRRARTYLSSLRAGAGGTTLMLDTEDAMSALQDVKRMRALQDLRTGGFVEVRETGQGDGSILIISDLTGFESEVAKRLDAAGNNQSTWYYGTDLNVPSEFMYAQVDTAIAPIAGQGTINFDNDDSLASNNTQKEFGEAWDRNRFEIDFDDNGNIDFGIYELAIWNNAGLNKAPYPVTDLSAVVDNPWHPAVIAGVLFCSTDAEQINADRLDMVNGQLGLGVPWMFGDEGIQDFIDIGNQDLGVEIDQLIFGWDGEPVDVLSTCIRLMLSAGYYLAPTTDGYLKPRRFETLTVATYASALNNRIRVQWPRSGTPTWEWDPGFGEAITEKTAEIAKTPMYEGFSLRGLSIGASARIDKLVDPVKNDFDFRHFQNNGRRVRQVQDFLERQAAIMRSAQPRVTFKARDFALEGLDYDIGVWATIDLDDDTDALIFDFDGTRRTNDDLTDVDLTVLITGREPSDDFGSYTLTGRAVNYGQQIGRFRAPSAEVLSWDGVNNIITVSSTSAFSSNQSDENGFTAGQQVQLYTNNGALRTTTVQEVVSVSTAQEIELDGDFGGTTPVQGDILELATYDNYTFQDFGTLRGYCYLADDNDTLGTAGDDADEWQ